MSMSANGDLRILKERGHDINVLKDAEGGGLVDSVMIPVLDQNGNPVKNQRERALKLSIAGLGFLEKIPLGDGSTKHIGDTIIDVKDVKGDAIISTSQSGSQQEIKQIKESNGLDLPIDTPNENFFLQLGEWLLKILSGSLVSGIGRVIGISII